MRFRTTLVDINTLTRIIQTIHKVSPRCLIRLEGEHVRFICTAEADGVSIWSQISVEYFFKDYRVESNYNNEINFEINTDTLLQALRSAQNAVDVMMRLAKRDKEPLLSFAIANMVS
jgi:HUS1 checkpoint protein